MNVTPCQPSDIEGAASAQAAAPEQRSTRKKKQRHPPIPTSSYGGRLAYSLKEAEGLLAEGKAKLAFCRQADQLLGGATCAGASVGSGPVLADMEAVVALLRSGAQQPKESRPFPRVNEMAARGGILLEAARALSGDGQSSASLDDARRLSSYRDEVRSLLETAFRDAESIDLGFEAAKLRTIPPGNLVTLQKALEDLPDLVDTSDPERAKRFEIQWDACMAQAQAPQNADGLARLQAMYREVLAAGDLSCEDEDDKPMTPTQRADALVSLEQWQGTCEKEWDRWVKRHAR